MNKKQEIIMIKWFKNYFSLVLEVCCLIGYKLDIEIDLEGKEGETFSVRVDYPYRHITLYIRSTGAEWYEQKKIDEIRVGLFHEAFHIFLWRYKVQAESRYVSLAELEEEEENLADLFSVIMTNGKRSEDNN